MKRLLKAILVILFILAALYLLIANPFNLFTKKSSRFSEKKFLSINSGENISRAIEILGQPLHVERVDESLADCSGCKVYYFMGDPPQWLVCYKEAWMMVGPDERIKWTILNLEP